MGVIKDIDRSKKFVDNIYKLTRGYILIGIIGEDKHKSDDEMTVLGIANIHEFGFDGLDKNGNRVNIPERSFIRASYDENIVNFTKYDKYVERCLTGEMTADALFKMIGEDSVSIIQEYIRNLKEPANAPSTIRQKGSSSPLIDTGQLLDSITYEVRFD